MSSEQSDDNATTTSVGAERVCAGDDTTIGVTSVNRPHLTDFLSSRLGFSLEIEL